MRMAWGTQNGGSRTPGLRLEPKSKLRPTWNLKLEFRLGDPRPGTGTPNLGLSVPRPSVTALSA